MKSNQLTTWIGAGLISVSLGIAGADLPSAAEETESQSRTPDWLASLADGLHRFDLQYESLNSADIDISRLSFDYELQQTSWTASLSLARLIFDEDYSSFFGSGNLREENLSAQLNLSRKLNSEWSLDASARVYDGYSGYRSVWIAEYYRRLFGLVPGYQSPDPSGQSYSLAATWSYRSGNSVRLSAGYGRDQIAPGYSVGIMGLEQSRKFLHRNSATLRFDDTWSSWLKSEHLISYSDVSSRSARWGIRSTWHVALADAWTLRLHVGYSEEKPQFDAQYGGLALEWEFSKGWFLMADVSLYQDSGEIPNAGFVTTAAPGIETIQYGVGLRWVGENAALKIYLAAYENDFDALDPLNVIFRELYTDRDWQLLQISFTYRF